VCGDGVPAWAKGHIQGVLGVNSKDWLMRGEGPTVDWGDAPRDSNVWMGNSGGCWGGGGGLVHAAWEKKEDGPNLVKKESGGRTHLRAPCCLS